MTKRSSVSESAIAKRRRIHSLDLADGDPLANAPAAPEFLFTLEELATLLKPLMGLDAPRDEGDRILEVRPKGHWFESLRWRGGLATITLQVRDCFQTFATKFLR